MHSKDGLRQAQTIVITPLCTKHNGMDGGVTTDVVPSPWDRSTEMADLGWNEVRKWNARP